MSKLSVLKRALKMLVFGAGLTLIPLSQAAAQTLTDTETVTPGNYAGGGGAQVTVQFNATLQNAITLTLIGIPDGAATTSITGNNIPAGTVNFGNFNTLCNPAITNGECVRSAAASPTQGAHLVASFRATVAFSGAASADVGISKNVGGVTAFGLKYATGLTTAWTNSGDGTNMLDPLAVAAENNLGNAVPSGQAIDHQVALFFPDTTTAGAYTTTVRWTATTN
jgi:hypothetical protein